MRGKVFFALLCVVVMLCPVVAPPAFAKSVSQDRRFGTRTIAGTVVNIGGGRGLRSGPVTRQFRLVVNGYTSPEEARRLNEALQTGGQEGLLRELSRMDAGRIQIGTGVGVPANAIIASPH